MIQKALMNLNNGKFDEAKAICLEILQKNQKHHDALHILGIIEHTIKNYPSAVNYYQKAISLSPNNFQYFYHAGLALSAMKLYDDAINLYKKAITLCPSYVEAYNDLGLAFRHIGKNEDSLKSYQDAVKINPSYATAWYNMGNLYKERSQKNFAIDCYRKAANAKPNLIEAWINLGEALETDGHTDDAIKCYDKVLSVMPNNPDACFNKANLLCKTDKYHEAITWFKLALESNPNVINGWNNLGTAFYWIGSNDEAIACYQKALSIKPDDLYSHANMSFSLLLKDDYKNGFQENEWRIHSPEFPGKDLQQPYWDGSSFENKTLLVYTEQGFGDNIQFVRYLPLVKERGGKVIFICSKVLFELFSDSFELDSILTDIRELPQFDFHVGLYSLPAIFGTTTDSIPQNIPYLKPPDTHKAKPELLNTINKAVGTFRIGIIWAGRPDIRFKHRSASLKDFIPLAGLENVTLFSFQMGTPSDEIKQFPELKLIDLSPFFDNFSDTATAVSKMDLVISVDTAVAHLAGALGKKVFLLIPYVNDWRWSTHRSDSSWYPSISIFRQPLLGDWASVIKSVLQNIQNIQTSETVETLHATSLQSGKQIGSPQPIGSPQQMDSPQQTGEQMGLPQQTSESFYGFIEESACRSFVIPILDFSPHSKYNILTLLDDLENIDGEVICIFNSKEVFEKLKNHKRINKFAYNKLNAGVCRSWNMGINLAQSKAVFVLNADLHIEKNAVEQLEHYLFSLENAVIVGPEGTHINYEHYKTIKDGDILKFPDDLVIKIFSKGTFDKPTKTDDVAGFLFCIHLERFLANKLSFDIRFSPCFLEEWDMGLQIKSIGLACYAVPVLSFDHCMGISQQHDDTAILYFGQKQTRKEILLNNAYKFINKWLRPKTKN